MPANRIKEINDRKMEIRSALQGNENVDLKALKTELEKLDAEAAEIRSREDIASKINLDKIETKTVGKQETRDMKKTGDWASSIEYRNAFMAFAKTGVMAEEFRAVATTSGNSAVIPVPTMNIIIQKLESYGNILPLVSRVNYPAGVTIPTSQLGAAAIWTTDADLSSKGAAVDGKTTGTVTFSAFPLVKAVGLSFVAQVQSLSAFETALANEVPTAMGKALEQAIINGTGHGQPTGILEATAASNFTLSKTLSFKDLIGIKKSIPSEYRTGAVLLMNETTFFELYGITDSTGQPIARINQNVTGDPEYQILGTRVICTDWMPDYTTAAAGATVIAAIQPEKYVLNCAYSMDLVTYVEQTTRNKIYQSFAMYDGKVVDTNGLLFVNKPAA